MQKLVVPTAVGEEWLKKIAQFRSRARIPVLVWIHPETKAALTRSAQPLCGLSNKRCPEDEDYLSEMRKISGAQKLYISDCRPKLNAAVNQAMGYGYENTKYYKKMILEFNDIANIHVMREALNKFVSAKKPGSASEAWLKHISKIFGNAQKVIQSLEAKQSVLLHCSDGWDRTAQVTSVVQITLDPFYRTIQGFAILIEKEWLSFGHKFAERCGHNEGLELGNLKEKERAPIFLQV